MNPTGSWLCHLCRTWFQESNTEYSSPYFLRCLIVYVIYVRSIFVVFSVAFWHLTSINICWIRKIRGWHKKICTGRKVCCFYSEYSVHLCSDLNQRFIIHNHGSWKKEVDEGYCPFLSDFCHRVASSNVVVWQSEFLERCTFVRWFRTYSCHLWYCLLAIWLDKAEEGRIIKD